MEVLPKLVKCSSEKKSFFAKNLLTNDDKTWRCEKEKDDKSYVEFHFSQPFKISCIEIGNDGSAFVEIQVLNTAHSTEDYQVILTTTALMTATEAIKGNGYFRIKRYLTENFTSSVAARNWDRIKIICSQPFNRSSEFGLAYVKFFSVNETKPKAVGDVSENVKARKSASIDISKFFKKSFSDVFVNWPQSKSQPESKNESIKHRDSMAPEKKQSCDNGNDDESSRLDPTQTQLLPPTLNMENVETKHQKAKPLITEAMEGDTQLMGNSEEEWTNNKKAKPLITEAMEGDTQLMGDSEEERPNNKKAKPLITNAMEGDTQLMGNSDEQRTSQQKVGPLITDSTEGDDDTQILVTNIPQLNRDVTAGTRKRSAKSLKLNCEEETQLLSNIVGKKMKEDTDIAVSSDKQQKEQQQSSSRQQSVVQNSVVDHPQPSSSSTLPDQTPSSSTSLNNLLFDTLLENVVFTLSGYKNPMRNEIRSKGLALGAKFEQNWSQRCTHLICAFANTPKFKEAAGKCIIVNEKWIEDCYRKKSCVPWQYYQLQPVIDPPKWLVDKFRKKNQVKLPAILENLHFFLYGTFEEAEREYLNRFIISFGGYLHEYMNNEVKIVISHSDWDSNFEEAVSERPYLKFVKPEWLRQCDKDGILVPMDNFIISNSKCK